MVGAKKAPDHRAYSQKISRMIHYKGIVKGNRVRVNVDVPPLIFKCFFLEAVK